MSLLNIVNQLDPNTFDEEVREDFVDRKKALNKMGKWGKNLALSMVPLGAVAAFTEPAMAQSKRTPTQVLNYALTLEYLEATFYTKAKKEKVYANQSASVKATFDAIQKHETAHVNYLKAALKDKAVGKPDFNFTLGGKLQPFKKFAHFILLAQAFEDTGVRAYKGQAGFLQGSNQLLTVALRIHSVEARHASAVRRISGLQGWIPMDQPEAPKDIAAVYKGEANTTHAKIDVTQKSNVGKTAITEAWDEPLRAKDVNAIAGLFITSS